MNDGACRVQTAGRLDARHVDACAWRGVAWSGGAGSANRHGSGVATTVPHHQCRAAEPACNSTQRSEASTLEWMTDGTHLQRMGSRPSAERGSQSVTRCLHHSITLNFKLHALNYKSNLMVHVSPCSGLRRKISSRDVRFFPVSFFFVSARPAAPPGQSLSSVSSACSCAETAVVVALASLSRAARCCRVPDPRRRARRSPRRLSPMLRCVQTAALDA